MYEHKNKNRKKIEYPFNILNDSNVSVEEYNGILSQLPERSRKIVEYYFRDMKTLKEIADEFCITQERVRQLRNLAVYQIKKGL